MEGVKGAYSCLGKGGASNRRKPHLIARPCVRKTWRDKMIVIPSTAGKPHMSPPPPDRASGSTHKVVSGSPRMWCGLRTCIRSFVRRMLPANAQVRDTHTSFHAVDPGERKRQPSPAQPSPVQSSDQRRRHQEGAKGPPKSPTRSFSFLANPQCLTSKALTSNVCASGPASTRPLDLRTNRPCCCHAELFGACSDLPGVIPTRREPSLTHSDNA